MSDDQKIQQRPNNQQQQAGDDDEIYEYKDSHIQERHGSIPWWLIGVTLALIAWSIYYLIEYWRPPQ